MWIVVSEAKDMDLKGSLDHSLVLLLHPFYSIRVITFNFLSSQIRSFTIHSREFLLLTLIIGHVIYHDLTTQQKLEPPKRPANRLTGGWAVKWLNNTNRTSFGGSFGQIAGVARYGTVQRDNWWAALPNDPRTRTRSMGAKTDLRPSSLSCSPWGFAQT